MISSMDGIDCFRSKIKFKRTIAKNLRWEFFEGYLILYLDLKIICNEWFVYDFKIKIK